MASSDHKHTYSNWRAPCGAQLDDDDRTEQEAAPASAAEADSNLDTGNNGVGSCSDIGAGKAWRLRRRNGWWGFQVAVVLEEVAVAEEGGFSGRWSFAGHLLRYFRCSPWKLCRCWI